MEEEKKEHDERLLAVLECLEEAGLTLNAGKCEFRLNKLEFFGHEITQNVVKPSEEKIGDIRDAEAPRNSSEVRSFMGLVQFVSRFIPNLSSVAEPIQRLTRRNVMFE